MTYVGNPIDTRNTFQSLAGKRFSGDGSTTAFTLDIAPSSTLDIEVFVGNVRQDPNSAYTLSGTTLTFTGAPPSGTNNIYVVHQAKSVGTIDPPANSVGITQLNLSDGSNGQFIKTDGSGTLSFATVDTSSATDSFTISGSTPTLTIGDAGAEDTKIVFDGNAQDYHIGLDDSADSLVIGKGSTLGTTSHIVTDENGHVTMPLQTAFLTHLNDTQDVNSTNTTEINFNTEIFDLNADYNTSTKRFTAPVTGKYMLHAMARVVNADSNSGGHYVQTQIVTSNRTYTVITGIDLTYWNINNSVLADMDANDTAYVQIKSSNDTSWAVSGQANDSRFFGYLVA